MATTTTIARLGLPFVAAAAVLGACGDDDDSSGGPEPLSEAAYVEEVEGICETAVADIDAEVGDLFDAGEPSPGDLDHALDVILAEGAEATAEIRAVPAPADMADAVDAWLDDFDAVTAEVEQLDGAAFFASEQDPWAEANQQAAALGIDGCAQ